MTTTDLITFDDYKASVPHLQLRTIRRLMAAGDWPKAVRLSPAGPLLWSRAAIQRHLDGIMADLEVAQ